MRSTLMPQTLAAVAMATAMAMAGTDEQAPALADDRVMSLQWAHSPAQDA